MNLFVQSVALLEGAWDLWDTEPSWLLESARKWSWCWHLVPLGPTFCLIHQDVTRYAQVLTAMRL